MSLRRRLFLTLCLVVLIGFFAIARWIRGELRNSYSQVVEEILVDYAHVISAHAEAHRLSADGFKSLDQVFKQYKTHAINAKNFDFVKQTPALELYITDLNGVVIYSTKPDQIGMNFSQWNDVYRTLRGEYGARSTSLDSKVSRSSVYYVAAPIILDSKIVGAATVYKTESSILMFLDQALNRMFMGGLFSVIALGLIGGLIMLWITLPLERLRTYALDVSEGRRGLLPQSKIKEVRHLGEAFEKMRVSLEGKKTVEKYTQTLTQELKSPLTAIKGAADLCLEEIDRDQQKRGELSTSSICRKYGITNALFYKWNKEFMEAGKKRLAGDTTREATSDEVAELRRENQRLKETLADLVIRYDIVKKSLNMLE